MMAISSELAPPYSLAYVEDPSGGQIPELTKGRRIAATTSCIAVASRCEVDGATAITLGADGEVDPGNRPAFEGSLKTPSLKIAIHSVLLETILQAAVSCDETYFRVWVNDPREPDKIVVGVS